MDPATQPDECSPVAPAAMDDLSWAVVHMRAGERIRFNEDLIAAYQAASSPHSIRALKSDLEAFDLWCRRTGRSALPATPETVADYLDARAGQGGKPASLGRYKASIAKIHQLLELKDPTQAALVKLRLRAIKRDKGSAQRQARPLRFKGSVADIATDTPRGLNIRALLDSCGETLPELRDRALLSTAYDTGLRASELVAIQVAHMLEATDPEARLLLVPRSKGDPEGEGATAFLSPRSVRAITAWRQAAGIVEGPLFRRVQVRRTKARPAIAGEGIARLSADGRLLLLRGAGKPAQPARVDYDVGMGALHPGSIGPLYRAMIRRAFDRGALPDLTADDLVRLLDGISAHSTRVGLNQDLFVSGEELAGIMDALRWKSPRMPLAYNRNLAAEQGAAGRLMAKLG
uniref:Integrase-like protein n=1 Tax=Sphingomonas sp. JE1 TaxID=1628059 RepID=A0A0D4ZZP8_9SPHN|nr:MULTISPECIES: site-specific integrase [unclassified Sphingomonas]AJW29423.1 Integrase-like protein [Sphingomonas sp. JE1]